jgi:hypothetical protein
MPSHVHPGGHAPDVSVRTGRRQAPRRAATWIAASAPPLREGMVGSPSAGSVQPAGPVRARQDTVGRGAGPRAGSGAPPIPESVVSATRQPPVGRGRHGAASGPVAARRSRASRVRWWRRTGDVRIDVRTVGERRDRRGPRRFVGDARLVETALPRPPAPSDRVVTPAGRARRCTNGPAGSRPARGHGTGGGGAPPSLAEGSVANVAGVVTRLLGHHPAPGLDPWLTWPILLSGARRTLRRAVHVPTEIPSTGQRVTVAACDPAARACTTRPGGIVGRSRRRWRR